MSDLRENLSWLIGSVATAVGVAISWLVSSEIFVTLVAVLVGFLASYFLQTKTQKKAWKREYSVKIAETVYGSLFRQVKWIIWSLEKRHYAQVSFEEWGQIQEDHRYFMVDEKFRTRLDEFFERVRNYSRAVYSSLRNTILPKIANEETERVFNVKTDETAKLDVKYKEKHRNISTSPEIIECLISQTHPRDYALRNKSDISNVECFVNIRQRDGKIFHSHDLAKFNEFWQACLKRMREDETYRFIIEENDKLLEEARNVKKEIVKRIEEPWKI